MTSFLDRLPLIALCLVIVLAATLWIKARHKTSAATVLPPPSAQTKQLSEQEMMKNADTVLRQLLDNTNDARLIDLERRLFSGQVEIGLVPTLEGNRFMSVVVKRHPEGERLTLIAHYHHLLGRYPTSFKQAALVHEYSHLMDCRSSPEEWELCQERSPEESAQLPADKARLLLRGEFKAHLWEHEFLLEQGAECMTLMCDAYREGGIPTLTYTVAELYPLQAAYMKRHKDKAEGWAREWIAEQSTE